LHAPTDVTIPPFPLAQTVKTSMLGALNMLGLAKRTRSRLLLTSTSEIYGDPEVHPQRESYWGHVNCIGPRACYDEGKRISETLCYEYHKLGVSVRIARIFNTFGPRMDPDDGRVVSNFIKQALRGDSLTLYGDGSQTRSFQYVSDLLQGLLALMNCDEIDSITGPEDVLPINLGNPDEYRVDDVSGGLAAALADAGDDGWSCRCW
jgi:UDP-glucuronate decarboxylase